MTIAVTGHRLFNEPLLDRFAVDILAGLEPRPDRVITGMALGWDQAIARACVDLGIPFTAAVPFQGQEDKWPDTAQAEWCRLLNFATEVQVVSAGGYGPWKMHARNQWMVDRCDSLLALYGGKSGGTRQCVEYAQGKGVNVRNVWNEWVRYKEERAA